MTGDELYYHLFNLMIFTVDYINYKIAPFFPLAALFCFMWLNII